ncbi:MAG: primosomal protein N' [Bdellovibrionales bacterium]
MARRQRILQEVSLSLWQIAVEAPLREPLTYESELPLQRGQWVQVPLGRRTAMGVALGPAKDYPSEKIKSVLSIESELPQLHEAFLQWILKMADYYHYPVGLVAESTRPPLKAKKSERKSKRSPVVPELASETPPSLTDEQKQTVHAIQDTPGFHVHLVHGVTGSGKTEVYLQLLEKTLLEGKTAIVLVPEIALTPQLIQRFARRFGNRIAAFHSQMTPREKTDHWLDIVNGNKQILIGARSALFCPQKNLGLVIVDEEHEPSYKQDDKLRYHARDAAVMLAHFHQCPIVLGSATPSLESWSNARAGKYRLHQLKKRVHQGSLPKVEIVDLRQSEDSNSQELPDWLSPKLFQRMSDVLESGFQVALFLNRRGMANVVMCNHCGHSVECPNCDINLTLHSRSHLVCHYCDYHENYKPECSSCQAGELSAIGLGTEKLEQDVQKLFPNRRIARADRDEIQNREDLESFIFQVESGEVDILIGTQMIAKGLDFPKLKLVGLVLADIGFNLPDFRATERNFQLVVQMSGRPGRHALHEKDQGEVIIQTFNPEHESLIYSVHHDYEGFAAHELSHREVFHYPPLGRLISLRVQSADRHKAQELARFVGSRATALKAQFSQYEGLEILGPAEAPLSKLKGQYRYHLLLKGARGPALHSFLKKLMGDEKWIPSRCRVIVDIDPLHLL